MKKRFSDEQIVSILREAEAGVSARELCRSMDTPRFTPEFKEEAARQITERGYSVAEVSDRLTVWASLHTASTNLLSAGNRWFSLVVVIDLFPQRLSVGAC